MKRPNQVDLKVEQLDDRILPSVSPTATGIGWTFDGTKLTITGTPGKDMVQLYSTGSTVGIISASPRPGMDWIATNGWTDYRTYDTLVPLSPSLKIVINGGDGADYLMNLLGAYGPGNYASCQINGQGGDDFIYSYGGGRFADQLNGGAGNDLIYGGAGAIVNGGAGDDSLVGGAGSVLIGGAGNDWLNMNGTEAYVSGGTGNDTFRYIADPSTTVDDFLALPTDYTPGEDSVVAYSNVDGVILWTLP
jgi:Ca2+-binding RTX toxin-like protein